MIRILQIVGTMDMGGIENFIMNVYRNIDRNKIQFDFLIHKETKAIFEDEIIEKGGRVYKISSIAKIGHFKYKKELEKFLKKHLEYKIIHSHYNEISGIILDVAKRNGIKYTIAHSHSANARYNSCLEKMYKRYSRSMINKNADIALACSEIAGRWLFGTKRNFEIIENGIEIEKYLYNKNDREKVRKEFELKDEFVIASIARFNKAKNHEFMVKIMERLENIDVKIKLYFFGEGEEEKKIKCLIKERNLKNIEFKGVQKDIYRILNGMDLLLFPSLYEGLGIVAIESQANGLTVLCSENIPKEADLNFGLFKSIDLENNFEEWTNEIIKLKNNGSRKEIKREQIVNSKYNIRNVVKKLEKIYLQIGEKL